MRSDEGVEPVEVVDTSLKEEKETLEEIVGDCGSLLVKRRDRGLEDAVQLETREYSHCLEVFVSSVDEVLQVPV